MTSPPPELRQIAATTPAYRMGALLLGMGPCISWAPKPFDTIIPAELPGSPRFYTYTSGVAELTTGALSPASGRCPQLAPRTRKLGAMAAAALFVSVFPANVNIGAAVARQAVADADRCARTSAAADSDDHAGAQDLSQLLSCRRLQQRGQFARVG